MPKRYDGIEEAYNREEMYEEHMERRGVKHIIQYKTYTMHHPTPQQIGKLTMVGHTWSLGDRYYKLAHQYYGDSQWWWIIAWFNQKPTESHVELGEVINIPLPLDKILGILRGGIG
jgi:hypothetical protein